MQLLPLVEIRRIYFQSEFGQVLPRLPMELDLRSEASNGGSILTDITQQFTQNFAALS